MKMLDTMNTRYKPNPRNRARGPRWLRRIGVVLAVTTVVAFGVGWAGPATAAPTQLHASSSSSPEGNRVAVITDAQPATAGGSGSTTTLEIDATKQWIAAVNGTGAAPAPDLSSSLRQVGWNKHGPWINLSYTAQKVILAASSSYITANICRIPEVGWALCLLSAAAFAGLFELLKAHRICPANRPVFKLYLSNYPSYCE